MIDVSKPWVIRRGNTIVGFDPGDRESHACQVTMVYDPETGITTVTDIKSWEVIPGETNGIQVRTD